MKFLADTSILVAAMVESHPDHVRSRAWLERTRKGEVDLVVCAHTLAELYAVLTALPLRPRLGPDTARRLIRENVESSGTVVDLGSADYRDVLDNQVALGLTGGSVYDALAAQAARKAGAEKLLTLDEGDFRRVWPDGADRITPP